MGMNRRTAFAIGLLMGVLAVAGGLWWAQQGPSEARVRRTVVTTIQEEAPASFLVTGTLDIRATVTVDSAQYATPHWLTTVLNYSPPALLSMLRGRSQTTVQVPGRISYGFDVRALTAEQIRVEDDVGYLEVRDGDLLDQVGGVDDHPDELFADPSEGWLFAERDGAQQDGDERRGEKAREEVDWLPRREQHVEQIRAAKDREVLRERARPCQYRPLGPALDGGLRNVAVPAGEFDRERAQHGTRAAGTVLGIEDDTVNSSVLGVFE